MHICIIEDEEILNEKIVKKLENNGFLASGYTSYKQFIQYGDTLSDLYVIDISLWDGSGFDIIHYLREQACNAPIIILSGYSDSEKIIYGLNIGADDYMTKPFVPEVLVARIQALLRRPKNIVETEVLEYKNIRLTPSTWLVEVNNIPVHLSRKEFFILELLLKSPSEYVDRDEFISKIWGSNKEEITNNNINVTLLKLRRKLWETVHIETNPVIGYRIQ